MAPEDFRRLVDVEANLDDRHMSQVRFGRSRFLRAASLALFGLAAGLVAVPPPVAKAAPTPEYCHDAPGCNKCRGSRCISSNCSPLSTSCINGRRC